MTQHCLNHSAVLLETMQPGASSEPRSYTDIAPQSHWMQTEEGDTLIIDASGFRKDQMRVLINTSGSLKVSGERPLEGNQWLRFSKSFAVPKRSNPKAIQAKFDKEEGLLYVVLPKHVPQQANSHDQHAQAQGPLQSPKPNGSDTNKAENGQDLGAPASDQGSSTWQKIRQGVKKYKTLEIVVAAIVVILGILAYLGYRIWK